jgi:uncharacterized protein (DUF1501 family)
VLWGGEFGRMPMGQGSGRDHHILAFSVWLAGGGVKPGVTWGATDELGYRAVEDVVHVHDLHATMLALCGVDHRRLTFRYQGVQGPCGVINRKLAWTTGASPSATRAATSASPTCTGSW